MRRGLMLLAVLSLFGVGVASAAVQQGETELSATAGWFTENGAEGFADIDVLFATAAFGYFLTDNIEVAPAAAVVLLRNDVDLDIYALGGQAKYHFMPTNQLVPYIGGQLFWAHAGDGGSTDGILWGPLGGVRFELNATNDLYVEGQYHIWSGDIHDVLDTGFGIFAGIVHRFK